MHLVDSLIAGIRGAENGTAELYRRGTSDRATWYATFEGAGANISGDNIVLDANGGAELYVNELVEVVVKDSSGNTVRSFTAGHAAPAIEVRSASFTGADYVTAASAAGNPTTLQAVLDSWLTSAGAEDFKALFETGFGDEKKTLKELFSHIAGPLFFNVKSTLYGATGDGVTDDAAAIQAAIAAATLAGGGVVVFPEGVYLLTVALTVPGTVSLWGMASGGNATVGVCELAQSTAGVSVLSLDLAGGSHAGHREIRGLRMRHTVVSTTAVVTSSTSTDIATHFIHCTFGSNVDNGTLVFANQGSFQRCRFILGTNGAGPATGAAIEGRLSRPFLIIRDCWFVAPAVTYNPTGAMIVPNTENNLIEGNYFDMSAMTAGLAYALYVGNATSGQQIAVGNYISDPTGGAAHMFRLATLVEGYRFFEDCNMSDQSGGGASLYHAVGFTGDASPNWRGVHLGSRERRQFYVLDNSAALQLNALEYATIFLERTDTTVQTLTTNFVIPNGSFTLVTYNNSGGAGGNITTGSASFRPSETFSIATNANLDVRRYRGVDIKATIRWLADSAARNNI